MKKLVPVIIILLAAVKGNAQLASDKPMDKIYTNTVQYKLQSRKMIPSSPGSLPSNAPLPKQVTNAKTKSAASNQTEETKQNLPSNKKVIIPAARKPRK